LANTTGYFLTPRDILIFKKPEVDPEEIKTKRPEVPQRNIFSSSLKKLHMDRKVQTLRGPGQK
jgi:hypothetical protein